MGVTARLDAGGSKIREDSDTIDLDPRGPRSVDVTITTMSKEVRLPGVRVSGLEYLDDGTKFTVMNSGANAVTVKDVNGDDFQAATVTLAQNKAAKCWLISAASTAGTWRAKVFDLNSVTPTPITTYGYCFGIGSSSGNVAEFNQVSGTWDTQAASMPQNLSEANGKDRGCQKNETIGYFLFDVSTSNPLHSYEPSTDNWSSALDAIGTSNTPFSITYEPNDDTIYFLGGQDPDATYAYDVAGNSWGSIVTMSDNLVDGDGWSEHPSTGTLIWSFVGGFAVTKVTHSYDTTSGTTDATHDPPPRSAVQAFGGFRVPDADGFFDVMGLVSGTTMSSEVWEFNVSTGIWDAKGNVSFTPKKDFYSWGVGPNGYVWGGQDSASADLADAYEYDEAIDFWASLASYDPAGDQVGESSHALAIG